MKRLPTKIVPIKLVKQTFDFQTKFDGGQYFIHVQLSSNGCLIDFNITDAMTLAYQELPDNIEYPLICNIIDILRDKYSSFSLHRNVKKRLCGMEKRFGCKS